MLHNQEMIKSIKICKQSHACNSLSQWSNCVHYKS